MPRKPSLPLPPQNVQGLLTTTTINKTTTSTLLPPPLPPPTAAAGVGSSTRVRGPFQHAQSNLDTPSNIHIHDTEQRNLSPGN